MRTFTLIIFALALFCAEVSIPSFKHSAHADELLQTVHPTTNPAHGVRYKLAGGSDQWDANARQRIVKSMDEAIAIYNANGHFDKLDTAAWSPGTPTADSNFGGYIRFGGAISTRVALHEIAHTLGIGTAPNWMEFNKNGIFTGKYATEMLRKFDGPNAVLHCDHMHIWPYGLNYDSEGGEQNYKRNVRMVAAIRVDLGLTSPSSLLPRKERITAARAEVAAAKLAVADAKAKLADAGDSRGDIVKAKKELAIAEKAEAAAISSYADVFNAREAHRAAQIALIAARAAASADDPAYQAAQTTLTSATDRLAAAEKELAEMEAESKATMP